MSFHVLHIISHGSYLRKDKGMLVYENREKNEVKKIPIEDLKAVVLAAKGVILSDYLISCLLKQDTIILHCDEKFLPVGVTTSLHRVVKQEVVFAQADLRSKLVQGLWMSILKRKVLNHAHVLRHCQKEYDYLLKQVRSRKINEAISARYYWRRFFHALELPRQRRDPHAHDSVNAMLNYGYAVMGSLCHRSMIIHGLNPVFGVHHKLRYRSFPLTYDLMEPMRAFVEKALYDFLKGGKTRMKEWQRDCAASWTETRVYHREYSLKLIDAIDFYTASVARCFAEKSTRALWIPRLRI